MLREGNVSDQASGVSIKRMVKEIGELISSTMEL
jgi:hypothetical protein